MTDDLIARLREMSRQLVLSTDRGTCHAAAEALAAASRPQQEDVNALICNVCDKPIRHELVCEDCLPIRGYLPAAPPPWQPISTAPKDGTEILALVSGRAYLVYWGTHAGQHSEPWWRDREGYGLTEPTHWSALPSPPASAPQPDDWPQVDRPVTADLDQQAGWVDFPASAPQPTTNDDDSLTRVDREC